MNCPKCGYTMSEFDVNCPRCEKLKEQERIDNIKPHPVTPPMPPPPVVQPQYTRRYVEVNHTLAWVAGCIPLIAILVVLGFPYWWLSLVVMIILNSIICGIDLQNLKNLGLNTESLSSGAAAILIPAYLFQRPQVAGGGNGYAILWVVLFIITMCLPHG